MYTNIDNSGPPDDLNKKSYLSVMDEILDDLVLGLCFRVHRAMKFGYLCVDEYTVEEGEFVKYGTSLGDAMEANSSGNSKKSFVNGILIDCPKCNKQVGSLRFTKHMSDCFAGKGNRSTKRFIPLESFQSDDDDDDGSNDSSFGQTVKKKKKKPTGRGSKSKKASDTVVSSTSDTSTSTQNPQDMSREQIRAFLNQKCGAISVYNGRMCNNTFNCSTHNHLMRKEVRSLLLQGEENNGADIDVDTADGDTPSHSSMELVPRSPLSAESSVCSSSTSGTGTNMDDDVFPGGD